MDKLFSVLGKNKTFQNLMITQSIQKKILDNWDKIFGELGEEFKFLSYRDRKLTVSTENPCWKTEVNHLKPQVLANIETCLGKGRVVMFHVKLDTETMPDSGPKSSETSQEKITFLPDDDLEKKIAATVRYKKKKGLKLCSVCEKMYDKDDICFTCNSQLAFHRKTPKIQKNT